MGWSQTKPDVLSFGYAQDKFWLPVALSHLGHSGVLYRVNPYRFVKLVPIIRAPSISQRTALPFNTKEFTMSTPTSFERYLALDIHKHYVVVGGVDAQQKVILPPRRLDFGEWALWMPAHLHPTDALVLEATTNAWEFYDQVAPRVGRAVVAHAGLVKMIASARVKTDKLDVLHLARLLAANLIPEVWVPPQEVRELRALLSHRRRLIKMRTTPALALPQVQV
jgi:hypothetical protein